MSGFREQQRYGYTEGCQNLHAIGNGSYCYALSALGVIWNEESKQQNFLQGHTAQVTAVAFSAGLLATGQKFVGSESSGIRIWSIEEKPKQKCQVLGHNQSVYSLAFSADGRWLFSIAAEERGRSKGRSSSELKATTSPLCVWRLDDSRLKTGLRQASSAQVRLAVKEKVRLLSHPEDSHRLLAYGGRAAYFVTCDWAAKDAARSASWLSPSPPQDPNGLSFYNFSAGWVGPGLGLRVQIKEVTELFPAGGIRRYLSYSIILLFVSIIMWMHRAKRGDNFKFGTNLLGRLLCPWREGPSRPWGELGHFCGRFFGHWPCLPLRIISWKCRGQTVESKPMSQRHPVTESNTLH